jgi:hypothetical protein
MRKLFILCAAILALCGQAFAADMAVKAQKRSVFVYPFAGSGFYWGAGIGGGVANANASGSLLTGLASGSMVAMGGVISGTVGYVTAIEGGSKWAAVEGTTNYQNIAASVAAANGSGVASVASRLSFDLDFKLGGLDLSWMSAFGWSYPTLPQGTTIPGIATVGTSHPYIKAGLSVFNTQSNIGVIGSGQDNWAIAPKIGAGFLNQIVDSKGVLTGAVLDLGVEEIFTTKGIQFSDPNGFGVANMGNQTKVYARVYF